MTTPPESSSPSPASTGASNAESGMTADVAAEINAAMESSLAKADAAAHAHHTKPRPEELKAAHDAMGNKPAIRGPRVVQSGREHRHGRVVSVGPTDIFLEFGPRELGVIPRLQFKDDELPQVAGEVEVVVDKFDRDENLLICSRPGLVQKADWELLEPGQIVEARVTGVNKGGLELEVAHHRAFMPASQVDTRRIEDLSVFVGEKLKCKVTRVDRTGRGNITLSRRDIVGEERKAALAELRGSVKEGDTREGVVRKIMQFGMFVDIGGVDGLVHISDVSHERLNKIDGYKEGDKVTVKVLKLDWDNERHSLGIKQLSEDPWMAQTKDVVEGAILTGKVTKLAEFGCFIEVAAGVEGLCHISELDWKRVGKTSDSVQPNKVVKVKVLKIDPDSRKISLSIKQAMDRPAGEHGAGRPAGGGGGGRGRRDRGEEDTRKPEDILKETPALRRAREEAAKKHGKALKSGLGTGGGLGMSLSDLKL